MKLTREEILNKLVDILVALDASYGEIAPTITESTALAGDLNFDSVSMLYMMMAIEQRLGIMLEGISADGTVGDIVDFIYGKQN